jgi:hypothetical protein
MEITQLTVRVACYMPKTLKPYLYDFIYYLLTKDGLINNMRRAASNMSVGSAKAVRVGMPIAILLIA